MQRDDKTLSPQSRSGFSLVELLVYMAILSVLMALVVASFTQTQRRSAQQSGIAETQIETGVGLGLLRADLASAGFGLPWAFATATPVYTEPLPLGAPNSIPAALGSVKNSGLNNSDRLVIRATSATQDPAGQKWGYLGNDSTRQPAVQSAGTGSNAFSPGDWVIALQLGTSEHPEAYRSLAVDDAGTYKFQAVSVPANPVAPASTALKAVAPDPQPWDPDGERLLLYGIGSAAPIRPFNRTDYYIADPVNGPVSGTPNDVRNRPAHCAPGTGVLMKATLRAGDAAFPADGAADNSQQLSPVADCVADFQVVYLVPAAGGGLQAVAANQLTVNGWTAEDIRNQVKEVRCFILLHEGGKDRSYTYPDPKIKVGEVTTAAGVAVLGRTFDVSALAGIGTEWPNYRWKVVSVTVSPKNFFR